MAHISINTPSSNGLFERGAELLQSIQTKWANHKLYQRTFDELSALSDRELEDLGLHRSEIKRISLEAIKNNG